MTMPSAGIRATLRAHQSARAGDVGVVDDLGEDAEVRERRRPAIVSPVSSSRRASIGPRRWKNMCSEPSAGPRKRVAGMPTFGVAADDGDVGHERQLEAAAERVAVAPRRR